MPEQKQRASDPLTPVGMALFAFVFLAPVVAMGWLIADPLDWFDGMRINKASGLLLLIAISVGLVVLFLVAFLLYVVLSMVLEAMGIQLTRPATAGPVRAAPGPAAVAGNSGAAAPGPAAGVQNTVAMHGLTAGEVARAQVTGACTLYAYGDDAHGWPESYLQTVAVCLNDEELKREHATRPLQRGWDGFKNTRATPLLSLVEGGDVTPEQARVFFRRIDAGEPYQKMEPPLTPEEHASAAGVQIYYVQYEDNFHYGGGRDSFAVAVCLTETEAAAEAARRGKPAQPGTDGYKVEGPYRLDQEGRPGVVREVLARAASGEGGCVSIDSKDW